MQDSQITRPSMLIRLRDKKDGGAWSQFVRIYSPLVYQFARRNGLQDADAADVTQDVLRTVAQAMPDFDYDSARGSFRGWLMCVARTRFYNFLTARRRQTLGSGDTATLKVLENQPSPNDEEHRWEQEYRKCVFDWAAEEIRDRFQDSTWSAFWQTSVEGRQTKEVACSLGMTVEAVYLARSRVLARLRRKIQEVEE